jgi:hypothetical protein
MLNDNMSTIHNLIHEMCMLVLSFEAKQPGLKKGEINSFFIWKTVSSVMCSRYNSIPNSVGPMQISVGTVLLDKNGMLGFIHSFNSLSHDRSKASSKASCPHCAI